MSGGSRMEDVPRAVLVEASDALPGLFPFQAWEALSAAERVYLRNPEAHPSAAHLHLAGLELAQLEPAPLKLDEMDLSRPGSPEDRRLAKALLQRAAADGRVTYLLGPDDAQLGQVVGGQSRRHGVEIEFVFFVQQPAGAELLRLVEIERHLRDPDGGCPWDLEQDHASLTPYLLEETYELLDAIDSGSDTALCEELGDVLLQVVFHAQIAADRGAFTVDDVARGVADKLVHRHPHVFGDVEVADADDVKARWEVLKQDEKGRDGPFDGVPDALPALMLAAKLQRRAARLGFDWPSRSEPAERVREEVEEALAAGEPQQREEEIGDLLGAAVGLARWLDVDPERALRAAATKFRGRVEAVLAAARRQALDLEALDRDDWLRLWDQVKAAGG